MKAKEWAFLGLLVPEMPSCGVSSNSKFGVGTSGDGRGVEEKSMNTRGRRSWSLVTQKLAGIFRMLWLRFSMREASEPIPEPHTSVDYVGVSA